MRKKQAELVVAAHQLLTTLPQYWELDFEWRDEEFDAIYVRWRWLFWRQILCVVTFTVENSKSVKSIVLKEHVKGGVPEGFRQAFDQIVRSHNLNVDLPV